MTISIISSKKTQNERFPRVGRYIILEMIIPHRAGAFDMLHIFAFHALIEILFSSENHSAKKSYGQDEIFVECIITLSTRSFYLHKKNFVCMTI